MFGLCLIKTVKIIDVCGLVVGVSAGENIDLDGVMTKMVLVDLVDERSLFFVFCSLTWSCVVLFCLFFVSCFI